jgi:hypothetical protein
MRCCRSESAFNCRLCLETIDACAFYDFRSAHIDEYTDEHSTMVPRSTFSVQAGSHLQLKYASYSSKDTACIFLSVLKQPMMKPDVMERDSKSKSFRCRREVSFTLVAHFE